MVISKEAKRRDEPQSLTQTGTIARYDFRRPNKFSKEQLRTLKIIHEKFSRIVSNYLTAFLRLPVKITLEAVSQVSYEEFTSSMPQPTMMTIFSLSDRTGVAMLETGSKIMFPVIDILFGGEGKLLKQARELTEIELSVMNKVSAKILNNLGYAWGDVIPVSLTIEGVDTNPRFNQLVAANETVALIKFSTEIGQNKGIIQLCFPYIALEPVLAELSTQYLFLSQTKTKNNVKGQSVKMEKKLNAAKVELVAILGKATITIEDFLLFQVGDVIQLDRKLNEPVDLCLEGRPMFKISLGTIDRKMGGVIKSIINNGGDASE
jgi:flagellar motor switch protein FliM